MSSATQNPLNLLPPYGDAVAQVTGAQAGMLTPLWDLFFRNQTAAIKSLVGIRLSAAGASFNGHTNDTPAMQRALSQAAAQGGGIVFLDQPGTLLLDQIVIPRSMGPIIITGLGPATVIKRRGAVKAGQGFIDCSASNVVFSNFLVDGSVTTPVGLQYNTDFNTVITQNDPMAPVLTTNSTFWMHGPCQNIQFQNLIIQHTGGYSVLLDATTGSIQAVDVLTTWFINNRPNLFGNSATALIYGSWTGGILAKGDGRTAGSGVVTGLDVLGCRFERNTGNCLWSHLYGLNALHSDFRWIDNRFLDCGLDAMELGGVTGGMINDNVGRRIGYICMDDVSRSVPRWGSVNSVFIDSAGVVKGVCYDGNSITSPNGGAFDLDGHSLSSLTGNSARIPFPDEPEYVDDQIAITGPSNSGSASFGINGNNTNQTAEGDTSVDVNGNTLINFVSGAVRLYGARYWTVRSNNIYHPVAATVPPVVMGPVGPGANQRCYDNRVVGNDIFYNPGSPAYAVSEDDSISAFVSGEADYVADNNVLPMGQNVREFNPSTNGSSQVAPQEIFVATETGANGAIACAAATGPVPVVGLRVRVLLAHTLTGGAGNTFTYNAGTPVAIMSARNPANNIATGYVVGAVITMVWSGSVWLDGSQ